MDILEKSNFPDNPFQFIYAFGIICLLLTAISNFLVSIQIDNEKKEG